MMLEKEIQPSPSSGSQRDKPYAIVVGLDSGTVGLQTARLLSERRIPVIALARDPKNYCCRTRVCQKIIHVDTRTAALVDTLVALGPTLGRPAVLFPCQDESVVVISTHRERLAPWYKIVLPPEDVVTMMVDKSRFYPFAQQNGLPVPQTFLLQSERDAQTAAAQLTYPCILKPENRSSAWTARTHEKAFLAQSSAELLALYREWGGWGGVLIAQEWIAGEDGDHFAFNGYFAADGRPKSKSISRKIRQWPPRTGQGCLSEPVENTAVEEVALALFAAVPFAGLGYVEVKRDVKRDRYVIIEPNIGRPTGRSAGAEANGVDLLYHLYCDALGRELDIPIAQPRTPVKWIHWRRDILAAFYYWRSGDLTVGEWVRSWQGPKKAAIFSWRDPGPFLADLLRSVGMITGRSTRRVTPQKTPTVTP